MAIRISRNEEGNCITFIGSSNPAYWNSCLSAVLSTDTDRFHIINDLRSANDPEIQYEFFNVLYTDFADADGNAFTDAADAVDYINANANVIGLDGGTDMTGVDINFRLDQTSTTILSTTGSQWGVNSVKAVAESDGTIHIHAIGEGIPTGSEDVNEKKFYRLIDHTLVSINGTPAVGGLQDVTNALNELFTVGAFEAVVIADPYSTMVADVAGVDASGALVGQAVNPSSSDIGAGVAAHYNQSGWLSTDTIDQAGEYFTFDIRNEGIIGMGLVVNDVADVIGSPGYGDPAEFCDGAPNSGHYGYQFGHFFHPTPNGPWTNYGASTAMVYGPGWSNATHRFMSSPEGADWLAGNPVKMRVGIDANGFISIDYYDSSESSWIVIVRTSYPTVQGVEYKLGIKFCDSLARLASEPKIHLLEAAAPTMYFRYIESPDNNFEYPLFATEEEANYYDETEGGTGTSHTHTYADDPTGTTWYMPDTNSEMAGTAAPTGVTFDGNAVTYTEITSLTNADLTPTQFSSSDYTYQEGTVVNLQLLPAGASFTQSVTISPANSGMVYNSTSGYLQGTLADVTADTLYTVTVTRANAYGSNAGTFEVQATNVAPVSTMLTDWNKALDFSGSNEHAKQVNRSTFYNPINCGSKSTTVPNNTDSTKTSNSTNARPWATTMVFQVDRHSSNQHIWNSGEGAASGNDNIYTRLSASGKLYFGWGREGVGYNECEIYDISYGQTGDWFGLYIAHKGGRFSTADATAANLADAFDIRLMTSDNNDNFATVGSNLSTTANWGSTGVRMDREIYGYLTVGGRASNRNFHGKVASMVVTTLKIDQTMPTDNEISKMVTDPVKWVQNFRVGKDFRGPYNQYNTSNWGMNSAAGSQAVQVWLMGDGASDSYANGMRNYVYPADQNNTKMQLNSMVSNDIESVNIAGLT